MQQKYVPQICATICATSFPFQVLFGLNKAVLDFILKQIRRKLNEYILWFISEKTLVIIEEVRFARYHERSEAYIHTI
jgi:hypothetical protein